MRLTRLLGERGDEIVSLIRNPDHADDVREAGAEPVQCDLEQAGEDEVAGAIEGADAVVFAAGAGPGSGTERKQTMDFGGAAKLIAAAKAKGIARYVIVSSIGADPEAEGDDTFTAYRRAKGKADAALAESGLDHTIVRPVSLTDDPGAGAVEAGPTVPHEKIPREDVAAVLAEVLAQEATIGLTFEITSGETPVAEAVAALGGKPAGA